MKRIVSLILIIIIILSFMSSCKHTPPYNNSFVDNNPESVSLPRKGSACKFTASVYSYSGNEFQSSIMNIETYNNVLPLNALVSTLLSQKSLSRITKNLSVDSVLVTMDVCILNLKGKMPSDAENWLLLEGLILNTLHDFCSCNEICMLINGIMPDYNGVPYGTASYSDVSPDEYVTSRKELLTSKDQSSFSGAEGSFFVHFNGSNLIYPRIVSERLFRLSDSSKEHAQSLLSTYAEAYTRYINRTEQKTYSECFSIKLTKKTKNSYSVSVSLENGYETDINILIKEIALTFICNMDNVEKVEITVDNLAESYSFDDLFDYIGVPFDFYYPLRNISTLEKNQIVIPARKYYSPSEILDVMLDDNNTAKTLFPTFLSGKMSIEYWADNTAVISLSPEVIDEIRSEYVKSSPFYDSAETRERLFIYAIVNTLTQLPNIDSVLFTEEGEDNTCESLLNIFLGAPLYANPGLNAE